MAQKRWEWRLSERTQLSVQVADELWYDTRPTGIRAVYLFRVGWYEHPDIPDYRMFVLTLPWLSIKVDF